VVAQTWSANGNGGRVVIYFGTNAGTFTTSDAIELRGDTTTRIGQTAQVIKDITGDGLDELAIAAPLFTSNRGRLFIYKGRDRAGWVALRTATDATTAVPYIPVNTTTADYVIDGPSPALVSPAGNSWGQNRRGLISVSDLDNDTFPDLAIPTSRGTINKYRVYGSATIKGTVAPAVLDATSAYRLEISDTATTDNSSLAGLGTSAVGNQDFMLSSGSDFAVSYPSLGGGGQVWLYSALTAATTPTLNPSVTTKITGPLTFGAAMSIAPVDGDTTGDVLAATNLVSGNSAWLLYQNLGQFETSSNLGGGPIFWVTRFEGLGLTGSASNKIGSTCLLTDVSGDGLNDVVLGDSQTGEVRVWK
jgi:hypothetical protein